MFEREQRELVDYSKTYGLISRHRLTGKESREKYGGCQRKTDLFLLRGAVSRRGNITHELVELDANRDLNVWKVQTAQSDGTNAKSSNDAEAAVLW